MNSVTAQDSTVIARLRALLREAAGDERFDLWFRDGVTLSLISGGLLVSASDAFTLAHIQKTFSRDLQDALSQCLPPGAKVTFQVQDAESKAKHSDSKETAADSPTIPISKEVGKASDAPRRRRLNTLDNFVCGESNRLGYTAAKSVGNRGSGITPLFVYGPTGSGKTHLLEGVWSSVRKLGVRRSVMLSSEQFTSQFLEALHGAGLPSFRRKYRSTEFLLLDDVQFFVGKQATITEVLNTLDTMLRAGKQVVMAADRSPAELTGLGPEMTARMAGGLVCGLEPADLQTRVGILTKMAKSKSIAAPKSVLEMLAQNLPGDARQLAGALHRLALASEAYRERITEQLAERTLDDLFRATMRPVALPDIERAVCNVFGLAGEELQTERRAKAVSHPRMLAMWLARKYTRAAFSEIGEYFGNRAHSTAISALKKVDTWVEQGARIQIGRADCGVEDALRRVEAELKTG